MDINPLSGQGTSLTPQTGPGPKDIAESRFPRDSYLSGEEGLAFPDEEKTRARINAADVPAPEGITVAAPAAIEEETSGGKVSVLNKTLAGLFIGTTLLGMAGCKPAPPPDPGAEPTSVSTELSYVLINTKQEIELGKEVAAQIEKESKIWQNDEAQKRIDAIGKSLAESSTRKDLPYTFTLIDTDQINAFALPGGYIYVTRGLYEEFKDDNELRFVMGHEMGHIEDRDSIKALERNAAFKALLRILTEKKGDLAGVAGELAASLSNLQLSQKDEFQADAISARHMIRNGVNPWYAVRAMEHLKKLEKSQPDVLQKIFSTHPPTQERIDNLKTVAKDSPQLK